MTDAPQAIDDDEIGTVRWFGTAWPNPENPAPVCDPRMQVEVPLGHCCADCNLLFTAEDSGVGVPYWPGTAPGEFRYIWWHLACWLRQLGLPGLLAEVMRWVDE